MELDGNLGDFFRELTELPFVIRFRCAPVKWLMVSL